MTPSVILRIAGDLLERLRLGREGQQVVGAVGLVVDLVGELAAAPDVVRVDAAAAALNELARALDDLGLALLGELRVEHEQDFVGRHRPDFSFLRS